ncbi:MAG: universal stress protein UspA [Bacteroidetes bacterium HGW-Bacteroidetes-4]|jgi:nucleotide-binding universal stress UspA family protein|nr:MAG: universal stress protein UspA [Bacteroidetes bacterium HGW-Bacteroidetes-4]
MEAGKRIIVPWDFTDKAENALSHAVKMSKVLDNTITLLHIVKKEKDIEEGLDRLKEKAAQAQEKYGIPIDAIVKEGTIFTTIGEYTKENEDINLVIMGTHGMKGMQKLTGSWALKVIVSSYAPFIVVQDPPTEKVSYDKIVFPVNFKSENREKLIWAIYFGKIFKAKIHFVKQDVSDRSLEKKVNQNLTFARKYISKYNVEYEIATAEKSSNFAQATLNYAKEIEADLMLIMTTKNIGTLDYVMGASEQFIIANTARIPVMCVNPRKAQNFSLATF